MLTFVENQLVSDAVKDLVNRGGRKNLKELANEYLNCGPSSYEDVMRGMALAGKSATNDETIIVVPLHRISDSSGMFVFYLTNQTVEELAAKIKNTVVKESVIPVKTLAKMTVSRLFALRNECEGHNKSWDAATANSKPYGYTGPVQLIEIQTVEAFKKQVELYVNGVQQGYTRQRRERECRDWLAHISRSDITDEVVRQAWDLYQVKEVLTS